MEEMHHVEAVQRNDKNDENTSFEESEVAVVG